MQLVGLVGLGLVLCIAWVPRAVAWKPTGLVDGRPRGRREVIRDISSGILATAGVGLGLELGLSPELAYASPAPQLAGGADAAAMATATSYPDAFVCYLSRLLLNYDDGCRDLYLSKLAELTGSGGANTDEEEARRVAFAGFVATVKENLARYAGPEGAAELLSGLEKTYGSKSSSSKSQLALLFSLLPEGMQPFEPVGLLLSDRGPGASLMQQRPDWSSLVQDPMQLLPDTIGVTLAGGGGRYVAPVVESYLGAKAGAGNQALALRVGKQQPFVRERPLTLGDYARFAACGGFGCVMMHASVIPIDVVKTRLQTSPGIYPGLAEGVMTIAKEEGLAGLVSGSGATVAGYGWYGISVYPGYELFKRLFLSWVGDENALLYRAPLVVAAGAAATCIACIGVCPAEAVRIRQVADPAVGTSREALAKVVEEGGWGRLYEGFPALLFRQVDR
ncbi:unnamed protein product [Chrysoparadoxa australica]